MIPEINPVRQVRWPKERLANFTDSVFAFAITLLVLNIMETYLPSGDRPLLPDIMKHASIFVTYTLTFLIVSRFWISHTRLFALIREYDRRVIDLNVALLFFITLFPFVAVVFGNHFGNRDATIMYASCFAAIGIIEYLIGRHVYTHNLLINDNAMEPHSLQIFTSYSLSTPILFIVTIFVAFISPFTAEFLWILFLFIRQGFRYYYRNNQTAEAEVQRL